jgi:hypothetical protein
MPKYDVNEIITAFIEAVNKLDNLRTKYADLEKENARLREAFQKYFGQSEATNIRALGEK